MKYLVILLVIIFSTCTILKADSNDAEKDFLAHAGTAYAFNTVMYGVCKKGLGMTKKDALLYSVFTTTLLSTTQEFLHAFSLRHNPDMNDILKYGVGTGLSVGTVMVFDF